jgi:hypothetical protein
MLYTEEEENDDDALHISLKNAVSNNKAIQLVFSTGKESPCLVELGQRARELQCMATKRKYAAATVGKSNTDNAERRISVGNSVVKSRAQNVNPTRTERTKRERQINKRNAPSASKDAWHHSSGDRVFSLLSLTSRNVDMNPIEREGIYLNILSSPILISILL